MYQKTCGATTAGTCAEPETEKDSIIVKSETNDNSSLKNIDCSEFDIVKAVQYGAVDRVRELVDAGHDVNSPDSEQVYLLHWCAINNRNEVIKLLLEKGASANVIGGELESSPLHWAVRQGHLAATVLLMKAGADPLLSDAEGSQCIHLASQFGHTAVVAYLIARNVYVDTFDGNGMTSLMWAAWKVMTLDPVRLLLTLGANTNLQDLQHGNTP
jgi:ankyrin repeat protein